MQSYHHSALERGMMEKIVYHSIHIQSQFTNKAEIMQCSLFVAVYI